MQFSKRTALAAAGIAAIAFAVPALAGNPHDQAPGTGTTACGEGTVTWTPLTLWGPPNHKFQTVNISYRENDGDGDTLMVAVTGESDNQTTNGVEDPGSGNTSPDWQPGDPTATQPGVDGQKDATTSFQVRDERSGRDGDRVYTLQVTCSDTGGTGGASNGPESNSSTVQITVTVPHDMGKGQGGN